MASGIIGALKSRFPNSRLTWMAEPHLRDLVAYHPQLDNIIVFPKSELMAQWKNKCFYSMLKTAQSITKELKQGQFDLAIDLQGLLKSGIWAFLSGATTRISFSSKEGTNWLMTHVIDKARNDPEISSEYKQMAQLLGCDKAAFKMDVHLSPEAKEWVSSKKFPFAPKQYMVFCPYTTRPQKHWKDTKWIKLAMLLASTYRQPIVVIGGPGDKDKASALVEQASNIESYCGSLSLLQSISVLERASLVVGVDTGMTHAAISKDTPTVTLFGSTRPYLTTDSSSTRVLYLDKSCAPCRRKPTCNGLFHCMDDIQPDQVLNAALSVVPNP